MSSYSTLPLYSLLNNDDFQENSGRWSIRNQLQGGYDRQRGVGILLDQYRKGENFAERMMEQDEAVKFKRVT